MLNRSGDALVDKVRERLARAMANDGALDDSWELWEDRPESRAPDEYGTVATREEWRTVATHALRSLRLAEDEGAVRVLADRIASNDYGRRAWPAYEDSARATLAALDRYLSGEQEAG